MQVYIDINLIDYFNNKFVIIFYKKLLKFYKLLSIIHLNNLSKSFYG